MRQVFQNLRNGETAVLDVPTPSPQPGEVLVRTAASLVSAGTERMVVEFAGKSLLGKARARPDLVRQVLDKARREGVLTTLEAAFNRLEQPMPLGYSSAGTIIEVGPGVHNFQAGQRVACAGGGFAVHAEYACVPVNLLAPLPEDVNFDAAAFTTLGAIALHGFRLAEVQLGERVAVIGLGLLGLLAAGIARAAGCQVLGVDIDPRRVDLGRQMGAAAVERPQAVEAALSFSRGRGCDAVLICADTPSTDPVELAGAVARDRARVVAIGAVGLTIPRKVYYEKELTFLNSRSYGPGRYDPAYEEGGHDYPASYVRWTEGRNLEAMVDLLAERRIDVHPLISHRFPIDQAPQAYELITGKAGGQAGEPFLGVLLTYPEGEGSSPSPFQGEGRGEGSSPSPFQGEGRGEGPSPSPFQGEGRGEGPLPEVALGVLGAGNFATAVLLPAVRLDPLTRLVGIVSASGASAEQAKSRFGFSYAASQADQVLQDPAINTVAILTRHHLHAPQVLAALTAGKNVFCEKPLALNAAELEQIEQALQPGENGSPAPMLMVGFNRRFAPLARRLAEFLGPRPEPLAAHYRVNAGFIPLTHWVHDPGQGGGRIIGEGCHFIDFLTFLVGAPPQEVSAQALPSGGRYREDNVVLSFTFPDGSLGTVTYLANGDKSFPKERVEVFCAGRAAALDDFRLLETAFNGKRQVFRSYLRQDKGHRAEWRAFSAALTTGSPPPIPYSHLLGVTRASFAAVASLRSGRKVAI
jgi:predicted dehydrogenase